VLIVAFVALRHPKQTATAAGSDTRTSTPPPVSASAPASRAASTPNRPSSSASGSSVIGSQPLIVLNDTQIANLAAEAAARFRSGGWTVTSTDEGYSNDILSTVAYYDPAVSGAHQAALALQRQYPTIKRVVARFPELPQGPIVVVLTSDYSSG
jgi:hypothetical protein